MSQNERNNYSYSDYTVTLILFCGVQMSSDVVKFPTMHNKK